MKSKKRRKKKIFILILAFCIVFIVLFIFVLNRLFNSSEGSLIKADTIYPITSKTKVYLAINETYELDAVNYSSIKKSIAIVDDDKVIGVKVGKTLLINNDMCYEIEVSDMINSPTIDNQKPVLSCGLYSEEENDYLDKILESKIENVGYSSRAGALEAARFLTLQFPYTMIYFSENERLPYCDGEGRYYHKGLYLNSYKVEKENITSIMEGPVSWGCPLYSIPDEMDEINAFDCSGFITWCLYNGGYDVGDIGAGPSDDTYDLTDVGEKIDIKELNIDNIKAGDLIGFDGHIGMIIGIDEDNIYVAHMYWEGDLQVSTYKKDDFASSKWEYVMLMDSYYQNDGKLNNYWLTN